MKQAHEYDIIKASPFLVMRRSWHKARAAAEKFGGKASEYLSECMKIVWKNHMADIIESNNETLAARKKYTAKRHAEKVHEENLAYAANVNKNAPKSRLVAAGKYSAGQKLGNFVITGLGQEFRPHTDMFSIGLTPDTEYAQYAYFN